MFSSMILSFFFKVSCISFSAIIISFPLITSEKSFSIKMKKILHYLNKEAFADLEEENLNDEEIEDIIKKIDLRETEKSHIYKKKII